jgi:hypothetical protein
MKMLKKLGNPLALVAQGFVLGAALFLATHPETRQEIADMTFASPAFPAAPQAIL